MVIIDRLLSGSKTYNKLLWSLQGISRTLSRALKGLIGEGLIYLETKNRRKKYSLTEKGRELVMELRKWGEKWILGKQRVDRERF